MNAKAHNDTTRIDEINDGIYRISTRIPPSEMVGGFTFNQFLIVDDAPLLFHTGPKKLFNATVGAINRVLPASTLRYISFSHFEQDECGALNEFLELAPKAIPLCGQISAMVNMGDYAKRPAQALADGEKLELGRNTVQWHDAPHVPHGWDCGFLSELRSHTLFCGDLFTQYGSKHVPLTGDDILESSESSRLKMDYYSHSPDTVSILDRLATSKPTTLACMHGASWQGDGAKLLHSLGERLTQTPELRKSA